MVYLFIASRVGAGLRLAASHQSFIRCSSLEAVTEKARAPIVRETEFLATAEKAAGRATLKHRVIEAIAEDTGGCWRLRAANALTQILAISQEINRMTPIEAGAPN